MIYLMLIFSVRNSWPVLFKVKRRAMGADVALSANFFFRPLGIGYRLHTPGLCMRPPRPMARLTLHIDQMGGYS
jgi:hypothetical protein